MWGHQEPNARSPLAQPSESQCSDAGKGLKGPGKERGVGGKDLAAASRVGLQRRVSLPLKWTQKDRKDSHQANGDRKVLGKGAGTEGCDRCQYTMGETWESGNPDLLKFKLCLCRYHICIIHLCNL